MARFELKLPKMGESVTEATLTTWLKEVGDTIELDEAIVEIATDKVDSELPSEVSGILVEKLFKVEEVIQVGQTIAIIETDAQEQPQDNKVIIQIPDVEIPQQIDIQQDLINEQIIDENNVLSDDAEAASDKFYSPLVKSIAKQEGLSINELNHIIGTGKEGRVTKSDILSFLSAKTNPVKVDNQQKEKPTPIINKPITPVAMPISVNGTDEIIEMTRMGKLISKYMVASKQTSAHVQSFIEVDVTNIVKWRDKVKDKFFSREGEKMTFTPIFMQAVATAIKEFPMINISVEGETIIKHKNINLGMATALADGNLIVPVIKNVDQLNLVGLTKAVNSLANKARTNTLKPDDIQDGTYTVTNVGGFGSVFGTPIINQPQVAILALGAIRKVPAVIETPEGDFIGIRQKMFLSHSYDHRVVNGALGGMFVKRVAELLENFDVNQQF